ncbi:hypothetical protein SASC598O02_002610 [Snodgrassella alvi SCGC AB-598-O02]|nr:hypothetical protein SASC598O02_002610 [Snodgrassella alvi SCGC AB-598-O02]
MLKKTAIRSGWCMLVLALAACTGLKQPAAPTEAGGTTDSPAVTNADNPYGSAPYTPPPPSNVDNNPSVSTPVSTGYVPNYLNFIFLIVYRLILIRMNYHLTAIL